MTQMNPAVVDDTLADPALMKELKDELARGKLVAERVHRSLLPPPLRDPRIDVDVRYLPVRMGGEYCQVRLPEPSTCYVTMCDVSGQDIASSLLATRVSSEVRHFVLDRLRPMAIVRELNAFICEHFRDAEMTLSFVAAQIDLEHKTITYSGAGHPASLLLRRSSDSVHALESQNLVVGAEEKCLSEEPEHTRMLSAGDRLLFYTDGLVDVADAEGQRLGRNGLVRIARDAMSAKVFEMADRILDEVATFRHGPPADDTTLIVTEIK